MNEGLVSIIASIVLFGVAGVFLLAKCLFLAPFRLGRLMLLANLVYEVAERKLRLERLRLDALLWAALVLGFGLWAGPAAAAEHDPADRPGRPPADPARQQAPEPAVDPA